LASLLQKGDKQTKTDSKISDSGGGKKMKAMIKRWLIASMIFSIPLLWSATSIAAEVNSIDIIDYGLYKTTFAHWQQAPDTHRGEIQIVGGKELIKRTKIIPAKGGAEFGIRYVVNGQDEGGQVDLLVKISHSELQSSDEWVTSRQIGSPSFDGWKFDSNSEVVPGKLTIELFHQGTKLAEKTFTIY
jgi:hypothetical protein